MGGETIAPNTPDLDTESSVSTGNVVRALAAPLAIALVVSGLVLALGAPPVQAHESDTLPTQGGETEGHNADDDGFWNVVNGFATKTGFRLVFHWDTDEPVAGTVEWGYAPDALDNLARPQGNAVDTAQVAFADIPREDVGSEIYFRVVDGLEGRTSEVQSFTAENAWTSHDAEEGVYEIDLVVQLDSESLPPEVEGDAALLDLARGLEVMGERVWDMTDGYVRVGEVLVMDTVDDQPLSKPVGPGVVCGATAGDEQVRVTPADVLVETAPPADSHTFGPGAAIDDDCTAYYVGRAGWLRIPFFLWQDEMDMASTFAHEFGHYAFGLYDIYPEASDYDCLVGVNGEPNNAEGRYDVSVMHNQFAWTGDRWQASELDTEKTNDGNDCPQSGQQVSWNRLVQHYPEIPADGRNGDGLPDHSDSLNCGPGEEGGCYTQAKGNPDGGELSIEIMDNEPGLSKVHHWLKPPEDEVTIPAIEILEPDAGEQVGTGSAAVEGIVDRDASTDNTRPDATLSADPDSGEPGTEVTFHLDASDPDGDIVAWELDPADGSAPVGEQGSAPPSTVNHTYEDNGTYEAVLTVEDDAGATAQAIATVSIGGPNGTLIAEDPAEAPRTGSCNDTVECDYSWLDPAADGLDVLEARIQDDADSITFTWTVNESQDFFNDPDGDPAEGEVGHVQELQLVTQFQTSPTTQYRIQLTRDQGSSTIQVDVGQQLGVLVLSQADVGTATHEEGLDTFTATVPKDTFPETAIVSTLQNFEVSSTFVQNAGGSGSIVTYDDVSGEADEHQLDQMASLPSLSPGIAHSPQGPPDQAPPEEEAHIPDEVGDVSPTTDGDGHVDIDRAWFEQDDDHLYVGMKVDDIPADATTTASFTYEVDFVPSWKQQGWGEGDRNFQSLTAKAVLAADDAGDRQHSFRLEWNAINPDTGGSQFGTVAELPHSTIAPDQDMIWWVVPRNTLASPGDGDVLFDLSAETRTDIVVGTVGPVDDATGATTFAFSDAAFEVDTGGPYVGLVDQPIDIQATAQGASEPISCSWSTAGPGSFANASACDTTVTYTDLGQHNLSVAVTDADGETVASNTTAQVEQPTDERVEVRLGDDQRATIPVQTSDSQPSDTWSDEISLEGFSGPTSLTATWIDDDGTTLDQHEIVVDISASSSGPNVTIEKPTDGATIAGTDVQIAGEARNGSTDTSGDGSTSAASLAAQTFDGGILLPCSGCQGTPATGPALGTSATWSFGHSSGVPTLDGFDGKWFDVSGWAGAAYELDNEFDVTTMDVWFFNSDLDPQSEATGNDVGPTFPKTGTVPADTNWAFVYIRHATADEALQAGGFLDTAVLTVADPLTAPQNLLAEGQTDAIQLSWTEPASTGLSEVTEYRIFRDDPTATYATVDATTTSFTDAGLADGETHDYWVAAVNEEGQGPQAGAVTASAGSSSGTPPTKVQNLTAIDATSSTISLAWDAASDEDGIDHYNVYRDDVQVAQTTTTGLTDEGLSPETTYAYNVSAVDQAGNEGPRSDTLHASTTPAGNETVTVEVSPGGFTTVLEVDTSEGSDTWATLFDSTTVADGEHTITATYDDGAGTTADASIQVLVANAEDPVADAGPDQRADELEPVSLLGTAEAGNGDDVELDWAQIDGPAVSLKTTETADGLYANFTPPDRDGDRQLAFELTANDSTGNDTDVVNVTVDDVDHLSIEEVDGVSIAELGNLTGTVNVTGNASFATVPQTNTPPEALVGSFQTSGLTLTADASASQDPDGDIIAYRWDLGDGTTASGAQITHTYDEPGVYEVTLTVIDDAGALDQDSTGPFVLTEESEGGFRVDAGDSDHVRKGDLVTLSARSYGAQGDVTYTWDADGDDAPDATGRSVQIDTSDLGPGLVPITVTAVDDGSGERARDTVEVSVYETETDTQWFSEQVLLAVNDEDAGSSGDVDNETYRYPIDIPANTHELSATLNWSTYVGTTAPGPTPIFGGDEVGEWDFDLYAFGPDGGEEARSASLRHPESITVPDPETGTWNLEVRSYTAVNQETNLTVNVTAGPPSPVPIVEQTSKTCWESETQTLSVDVHVPADVDGVSGAWDLDDDGVFETEGFTAETGFPQGSGAHLVSFRANVTDGLRTTIEVAVRVAEDCAEKPPVVVVGVADTGINPYHADFAGELVPDAELQQLTTADGTPGSFPNHHAKTGELLPFTKHPSTYIPGFPAEAQALNLTLGDGFYKGQDDADVWNRGHDAIPLDEWFWFPGTKIVGAIDDDDVGSATTSDDVPLYDENGHGTASASVAVGNQFGNCPRCLLVVAEGLGGDHHFFDEPWIDFVSVSAGTIANAGNPLGSSHAPASAAERGQTISYAAGNGLAGLLFDSPTSTWTSNRLGPDWTIAVGAVQMQSDGTSGAATQGTGKPVDLSSFGGGPIRAACNGNYMGDCGHSGTSAATPITTGHMANSLHTVRSILQDTQAGQKTPTEAGGQNQAIAVGDEITGSPYLEDGVLQRAELWRASFHCASPIGQTPGTPWWTLPRSPADFTYAGYGVGDQAMQDCATAALLGEGETPARPNADTFFDIDAAVRDQLWGDWDGSGDGQQGGDHDDTTSQGLPDVQGLVTDDSGEIDLEAVDSSAGVTALMGEVYAAIGADSDAPAPEATYYLHRDGCGSGNDRVFMNRTPATDQEAGHGCASLAATSYSQQWTSTVETTQAYEAGSLVNASVEVFPLAPAHDVRLEGVLEADGDIVGTGVSQARTHLSLALVSTPCEPYDITFRTDEPIPEGATLTFRASSDTDEGNFASCYRGGPDASNVHIEGITTDLEATSTIASPDEGATLDRSTSATVDVEGTATFPPAETVDPRSAYLRWSGDGSGGCGERSLTLEDGADDGDGCALVAGAASPILDIMYDYPAAFDPVTLEPGSRVTGSVYVGTQGATASEMVFVLRGDGDPLGRQLVTLTHADLAQTTGMEQVKVDLVLDGLDARQQIDDLVFEVHVEQQGAVQFVSHDAPASFVDLPFAPSEENRTEEVQLSVDDPTFDPASQLDVTGTANWSATLDLTDLAEGSHTLYTRALADGEAGPTESTSVEVVGGTVDRQGEVQLQPVLHGQLPDADAWQATTFDETTGTWTTQLDTLALRNGEWDLQARGVVSNTETVRDIALATLDNDGRSPILDPIDDVALDENETVTIDVEAVDLDLDPITLSASGLPEGARFVDHGDGTGEITWTPTFRQAGSYDPTVVATDDDGQDTATFTLDVQDVNTAPELDPIPDQHGEEMSTLSFTVDATDEQGDELAFDAEGLPAGASFDAEAREFTWRPDSTQAGQHEVTILVTDEADPDNTAAQAETDEQTVPITVADVDRAARASDGLDYATIQQALDAVPENGTVWVEPGDHEEQLSLATTGVRLCGSTPAADRCVDGPAAVNVTASETTDVVLHVRATDVTVEGLTLNGEDTDATGLLVASDAASATIRNATARSLAVGAAVHGDGAHLEDNLFAEADVGLQLTGTDALTAGNELRDTTVAVSVDEPAQAIHLDGDRVRRADTGYAIGPAQDVTIDDAIVTGTVTAVEITAEAGSQPRSITVENGHIGLTTTPLRLGPTTQGVHVDAPCNDWGAYHALAIEERIDDQGTSNSVDYQPWQGPNANATKAIGCLVEPVASYTHDPHVAERGEEVQFTDESRAGSYPIVEWHWDFDDGTTSREKDPTHTFDEPGAYHVTLTVRDASGQEATITQPVPVRNQGPNVNAPGQQKGSHDDGITFPVSAESMDGDVVQLLADGEPFQKGATFTVTDQGTAQPSGTFAWDPAAVDRGTYTAQFTGLDEHGEAVTHTVELVVTDEAPEIPPVGQQVTRLGETMSFTADALDANGDPIELEATQLPANATFDVEGQGTATPTGTLSWTPEDPASVGVHDVTLRAEAAGLVAERTIRLDVGEAGDPPEITVQHDGSIVGDDLTAVAGTTLSLDVTVEDPDGPDRPIPTLTEDPDTDGEFHVTSIDDTTYADGWIIDATYTWEVPSVHEDSVDVAIQADDGYGEVANGFTIDVEHPPEIDALAPVIEKTGDSDATALVGEDVRLRAAVGDVDEDVDAVSFHVDGTEIDAVETDDAWVAQSPVPATSAGEITYTVTATDETGIQRTTEATVPVETNGGPEAALAEETIRIEDGIEAVRLDARPSSHAQGRPLTMDWTLPTAGEGAPLGSAAVWIPPEAGTYAATLEVSDHLGQTDEAHVTIVVEDAIIGEAQLLSHPEGDVGSTERPTLAVNALDETGAPLAGADVVFTVEHASAGEVTREEEATGPGGVLVTAVPFDTGTQPGVNLVGEHELEVVVSTDSDVEATPDVIEHTRSIVYDVHAS